MSEPEVTELVEPQFDDGADTSATHVDPAPEDVNADAGAPAATPDASEQDPKSSLTNDQSTTKTLVDPFPEAVVEKPAAAATQPALSPEAQAILGDPERFKRFVNLEKLQGQQANELGQVRRQLQQYEGIDPQQARTVLAEREKAAAQSQLRVFEPGHPNYAKFNSARDRRRFAESLITDVAPENQAAVKAAIMAKFSPEQQKMLEEYDEFNLAEQDLSPAEKLAQYRDVARAEARQEIQLMLQHQEQTRRTHEFVAKHPDLMGKEQQTLIRALDERTPRSELAAEIVALKAQLSQVIGNRGKDIGVVETARAQTAQSRQAAAVGRDPGVPRRKADPVAEALRHAEKNPYAFNDDSAFDMLVKAHEDHPDPNE